MKKIILLPLFILLISNSFAQYFQATIKSSGSDLIFMVSPKSGGGDIVITSGKEFADIELFVTYPSPATFTFGTPVTGPDFAGATFSIKGNDEYGTYLNKTITRFQWITNTTVYVPNAGLPKTYADGTEYELFRVPITGSLPTDVGFLLAANNADYSPTYIAISDRTAAALDVTSTGVASDNAFYGLGGTVVGNDQFMPLQIVTPVRFTNFSASKKDNNASLVWQITNEDANVVAYEVERSTNGVSFTKIATVAPKNNGISTNTYTLSDNLEAIQNSGIAYYRIKQIDRDGKVAYTDIRSVRISSKGIAIGIYPNPVKNTANLTIDLTEDAAVTVNVTDVTGKEVKRVNLNAVKGLNVQPINLSTLASGSYLLKVQAGTEIKTLPVVKTN